jgi:hypothetical protein
MGRNGSDYTTENAGKGIARPAGEFRRLFFQADM